MDKKTKELDANVAKAVFHEAIRNGVHTIWDDEPNIRIYPALNIEEELLNKGLTLIEEAIKKVQKMEHILRIPEPED